MQERWSQFELFAVWKVFVWKLSPAIDISNEDIKNFPSAISITITHILIFTGQY